MNKKKYKQIEYERQRSTISKMQQMKRERRWKKRENNDGKKQKKDKNCNYFLSKIF